MIEAAEHVASMVANISIPKFEADDMLSSAVQYRLMVIGEACSRLAEATMSLMQAAPFPQIRGFRNRIVHGYFAVDLEVVWEVATVHVPALALEAEEALRQLFPDTYERLMERRASGER